MRDSRLNQNQPLSGSELNLRDKKIPTPSLPVESFELACGATLLVNPRPGAPVTAVQVHLRGGHSLDPSGLEGLAYLTGTLLDQGTSAHTEEGLASLLEPAGGSLQGDANGLSGSIASSKWKLLLDLLSEVLQDPIYPKDKVERQRTRLLDRLRVEANDHRTQAARLFRQLVYGQHWLGRPSYGSFDSVAAIKRRDLINFHKKNWCASRAVIAICGDLDPQAVQRYLNRKLKGWKTGSNPKRTEIEVPKPAARVEVFSSERKQVHVYLGHLGICRTDPRYPALVVMDHILGTGPGFTNRICKSLRDEQGLAYSVHADIHSSAGVFPGTFTAYIGTSPENLEPALAGFLMEIRRIRDELVSPAELELVKQYLLGSFALGFERATRRVGYMVSAYRYGLPADNLERVPAQYAAVTDKDVRAAAEACLQPKLCCLAVGGPVDKRKVARALKRAQAN